MSFDPNGYALASGDGEHVWAFNSLMTIKAGGRQTHDAFTVAEILCPPGFGPPPHIHDDEDEAWYLLEGEMSVSCGERQWTMRPGSFVVAPRQIQHTFRTWENGPVKVLQITSPARFEQFAADMGRPAEQPVLPEPLPFDDAFVEKLMSVSPRYGIRFLLGPPPG